MNACGERGDLVRVLAVIAMAGLALLLGAALPLAAGSGAAYVAGEAGCDGREFHQLDFWIGDWDVFEVANSARPVGRAQVTPILGGCVLREVYHQEDGLEAESYSLWVASRGAWHQSWVTSRGTLLLREGRAERGRLVLTGPESRPDRAAALFRSIWWPEGSEVREKAERSTDGGRTWAPAFDIVFRPHRSP